MGNSSQQRVNLYTSHFMVSALVYRLEMYYGEMLPSKNAAKNIVNTVAYWFG